MSLLTQASLVLTPNAYKANKMYSIIPSSGNGDMTTTRATTATRINSSGLVENVLTGVPRIDYTDGVANILLEPQRTNLLTYSSTFTDASWNNVSTTPVLNSTILSPNGTTDSYKISRASTSTNSYVFKNSTSSANTIFTATIYAKLGDVSTNFGLRCSFNYPNRGDALFNLQTGALIGVANGGTNTNTSATIKSVDNGWYRCSVTTTFATSTINPQMIMSPTSLTSIAGFEAADGALSNCYVWGSQMEVGAYATSYIPTTTSTVTRNADLMALNNIYTKGLINSTGGTWFIDQSSNEFLGGSVGLEYFIYLTAIATDSMGFGINSTGLVSFRKWTSSVATTSQIIANSNVPRTKLAVKWNVVAGTINVFFNGTLAYSYTSQTFVNYQTLAITDANAGGTSNSHKLYSSILFPTPLTDAECISLTTL